MKYLASPYSHREPLIQQIRYELNLEAVATLTTAGLVIYSPIVHFHEVACQHALPGDAAFWRHVNFDMLSHADELLILKIQGWAESVGVTDERAEAHRLSIPERFLERDEWLK